MTSKPIKHFTAGAFVFSAEMPRRVLLIHHRKLGVWLQPGGHINSDENPLEAAVREVREETGVDIGTAIGRPVVMPAASSLPLPAVLLEEAIPAYKEEPAHFHIDLIYSVTVPYQAAALNARESHDVRWVTEADLDALPMLDNTRTILKQEMAK